MYSSPYESLAIAILILLIGSILGLVVLIQDQITPNEGSHSIESVKSDDLARRESYVEDHPNLSDQERAAILDGEVIQDMTREQVITSRGKPTTVHDGVSFDVWSYRSSPVVVFRNGLVDEVRWNVTRAWAKRKAFVLRREMTLSADFKKAILNGKVVIGMSKKMVEVILGSPSRRSESTSEYSDIDIWSYGSGCDSKDVIFENDTVSSINKFSCD